MAKPRAFPYLDAARNAAVIAQENDQLEQFGQQWYVVLVQPVSNSIEYYCIEHFHFLVHYNDIRSS